MELDNLTDRIADLSPAKRALLEMKLKQRSAAAGVRRTIPRRATPAPAPLSFAQERLWFLDQLEPESRAYHQPRLIRLNGALDIDALHKALDTVVARHDGLRTTFHTGNEHPVQVVGECRPVELPTIDISPLTGEEQDTKLQEIALELTERRFDLSRDLMLRGALLKLGPAEHVLLLVTHHIASDGWSSGILWRELVALYGAFSKGEPNPLPELDIQYADFAVWQRQWLQGEVLETQLSYWKHQLSGLPVIELPTDRPRPAIQSYRGAKHSYLFSRALSDQLQALSRKEGVTFFMTLLAAFQTLLYRYTGQDDLAVGSPIAGRTRPEIEGLIGFFVNMLVLRSDLSGNPTFKELLTRVRKTAFGAYEYQDVPFEKLVAVVHPDRDFSRSPLFQVMFAFQNIPRQGLDLPGLTVTPVEAQNETAKYDLSLYMWDEPKGLVARLEYNTDLFDDASIRRILEHFETLLEAIVDNPQERISDLPILTDSERQQLLVEWNATDREFPREQCVHQLFEAQVRRSPDSVALVYENQQLTYGQLNARANQLVHYLRKLGVGNEFPVGICMERSWEMVVAVLGVLKAGGAYVPLDPSHPRARLAFVMEDAGISVLLTQKRLVTDLPEVGARVVCLDSEWKAIAGESEANPPIVTEPENLAYLIYTSGSTGLPKGVEVSHRSVVNFLNSMRERPGLTERDTLIAVTTLSFDIAGLELYLPLFVGARLVVAGTELATDGHRLLQLIEDCGATVMQATPATWRLLLEVGWRAGRGLTILCGGEAMSRELADQLLDRASCVWNMYGPTETTVWSAIHRVERGGTVPVGRPIHNTQIYILDTYLNPVPIGVPGELYIGGAGLGRGYKNRPDLVAQQFIPNPFGTGSGTRLYRTGDLARYLADGNIEVLGRIDHQVKIRGFRIELGEIETVLSRHPAINQAIVADKDFSGDKRLIGYVVAKQDEVPSGPELKDFLRRTVPEYMVPSAFMFLDSLPLTPNGKLDRKALPAPDQSRRDLDETFAAPCTPVEELLANIWGTVLKLDKVGIHDNFFRLGGHSLLATQVISRVNDSFQTDIPLRRLFEIPTIAGLAGSIQATMGIENDSRRSQPIVPVPRSNETPLSFAQERLWFLDRLDSDSATYNIPTAFRLSGDLNVNALEQNLNEVVRRHEGLRTVFPTVNGNPVQKIMPSLVISLSPHDLSEYPENERERVLQSLLNEEAERPFVLSHGPLIRAQLLRLTPQDHVLALNMHHIVSDAWSMGVLFREISALYEAYCSGEPKLLPELPIQYADYAVWQRDWLQGENLDIQLSYWRKQLDGLSTLQLPTDHPRPVVQTYRGTNEIVELSAQLYESIKVIGQREGVTLFMTLLAAFQTLLHRYCGQQDIAVGTPIAGRTRQETEGLIGCFVNTLVLRADLSNNPTFKELLRQVRETTLEAYSHQDLPFEKLVEELHPERNLNISPLFQVMFAFQNTADQPLEFEQLTIKPIRTTRHSAKFDLSLTMSETDGKLRGSVNYKTDLFDASTIERMVGQFQTLLEGLVTNPEQPISELPLLTEIEKHQLLVQWNDTRRDYPKDRCIHQLFETQVEKTPKAIAVVFEDQQLTYRELNSRANQLAYHLRKLGVGPDVLVGICMERSIEMVVGLLGILKAGGAYVPLDPNYPNERLVFMLEDAQPRALLTQEKLLSSIDHERIVCLDRDWQEIARESVRNPEFGLRAENLAYVLYTSGSTGKPKGVMIQHRSLVNLCTALNECVYADESAPLRVSLNASIAFDSSVKQIVQLLNGHALCIVPDECRGDGQALLNFITQHKLDVLECTPAQVRLLIEAGLLECSEHVARIMLVGGEAIDKSLWMALCRGQRTRVFNVYGPTECTVDSTLCQIQDRFETPAIGRPIANVQVYLLDSHMRTVPIGVPGEIHIGGDGLARGYLNLPELTREKFIANPFSADLSSRLYKTGDLARYLPDGNIEFLGRIDNQVKIRGFRIELGEIEGVLGHHPAVREAVVLAREDSPGDKRLVAYTVAAAGCAPSANELRSFLQLKLPKYMVPSVFVFLDSLPLTPNGKLDREALPEPKDWGEGSRGADEYVSPRTSMEQSIAEVWQEVLGVERVSAHDNFFDLGGHSLLSLKVITRIEEKIGQRIHPREMILQTLGQIASVCEQRTSAVQEPSSNRRLRRWLDAVTSLLNR